MLLNAKRKMALTASMLVSEGPIILGAGAPCFCLHFLHREFDVIFESGIIRAGVKKHNNVIDASRNSIGVSSGYSIVDSFEMFTLIRSGRIKTAILGALEVSVDGDVACHSAIGRVWGFGGALDIYRSVKEKIFIVPEKRFVEKLTIPVTMKQVANVVVTEERVYGIR